jgi:hypothetical protein
MAKKRERQTYSPDQTLVAFGIGWVACAGISYVAEIVYDDVVANGGKLPSIPDWRIHMATASLGITVFALTFYSLEALARGSKLTAWRSTAPWLPLVALTAAASFVHMPAYAMILACLLYSFCAFRWMRSVK